ncbi:Maf family protein [Aurantimicrobium minutum]|uniref:Maf family protein n=1 Tax=Aurantimicrobium minutum TaxID=708131 RepID=UPI0024753D88|nr:nucleoside triphosphate pyrophosphatase [Aurantimicrobium minutum]MDH6238940.1 septum formation protein [Aurantimicrobium minutum]
MRLYLASTSPARLATLRSSGIEPVVVPSEVDEDAAVAAAEAEAGGPLSPEDMVQLLAQAKAEAVLTPEIDGLVLGGDSAFVLDGVTYGKPHTPDVAWQRWQLQRGRTGKLYSGHWLIDHTGGRTHSAIGEVTVADVTFSADISDQELEAYISSGEPLKVAGAFTIDSLGAAFIERIEGDPSTVVGVSVPAVRRMANQLGVFWPQLWNN